VRGAQRYRFRVILLASILLFVNDLVGQQNSPSLVGQGPAGAGTASLRICLRLQDDSPFSGPASVRIMPDEGYEIAGIREAEGEMLFSDVPPGTYTMETNAPGFLTVRQNIRVELGHHLLTRFVIMKAKPFPIRVAEKPDASASPAGVSERTSWKPPGVDETVPYVDPNVDCPLSYVLAGAGQRMKQFVDNLEKFTATERVDHFVVDATGKRSAPEVRSFGYVVMVSQTAGGAFLLDEYRNGSVDPQQFPAQIATEGMPAIALLFHPVLAPDFKFECEGMGQWAQKAAWQIHFVQRPDRAGRLIAYSAGGRSSVLALKGRGWIDPETFQVVRIETELAQPVKELALTEEHIAISYQPVRFRTQDQQLWLPQSAELHVERQGHRYYRRHTFSDYKLFTVETTQNVHLDKESYAFTNRSDRDIAGVLTVTPISSAGQSPISISFTIPAGGNVVKLVGQGKDIGIPVESVGSATFSHDGPQDAVQVDAHLSKESTLDVISGAPIPAKP
jgi:hypothetical protein